MKIHFQTLLISMFMTLCLLAGGLTATAADKDPNIDTEKTVDAADGAGEAESPASLANVAAQLIQFGDQTSDPLMLITAATIMGKAEVRLKEPEDADLSLTQAAVLDRARQYAREQNRTDLAALADNVPVMKGARSGPWVGMHTVSPGGTAVLRETFTAREEATVFISGNGATDLDLFVYDSNGNTICSSTSLGDDEICRWRPRWTDMFRIEIENLGSRSNTFVIGHN
jgi:hypothetical protein